METKHKFILEPYRGKNTRFSCPKCKKAGEFTRYINLNTGERLPSHVGICNRRDKCGYFFTIGDYLKENSLKNQNVIEIKPKKLVLPPSYIDKEVMIKTLCHFRENNFYLFLTHLIGKSGADIAFARYNVGTSKMWTGSTIFWQVDIKGKVRSGKIMLYNEETGKRHHKKQNWVHSVLKLEKFNLSQCLFGEHLLGLEENQNKTVAIVESEKTAIIASFFAKNAIWLATGGIQQLNPATNPDRFKALIGKNVILYPDLSLPNSYDGDTAYKNWIRKADFLKYLDVNVSVSDLLEQVATEDERKSGYDIADYLIKEYGINIENQSKHLIL